MTKQAGEVIGEMKPKGTVCSKLGRVVRPVLASVLMGAIIFTTNTFAHNIDFDKAWEVARNYARLVRKESNGRFLHYSTNCVNAFPGHNHYVRCVVQYQNAMDTKARVYSCKETIELFHMAHGNKALNYQIVYRHTSWNHCGRVKIDQIPGGTF